MKKKEILYNIGLFGSLLKFLLFSVGILNKYPDSMAKNDISIENNKISIKLCKIARTYKNANDKFYNSIGELLKTGLLDMEECPDKNFHQFTFRTANIQKYFKTNRINNRITTKTARKLPSRLCCVMSRLNVTSFYLGKECGGVLVGRNKVPDKRRGNVG